MARRDPNSYLDPEEVRSDVGGKAMRGGALTAAGQVLKGLIEIGSLVVLARILAPEDFGLLGMVISVTGFVALFKDLGLSMATIQREEITHEQVTGLFWVNVLISVVLTGITAAVAPLVAWFYGEPRLVWVTIGLAGAFLFGGLTVQHQAILRRNMRFGRLAAIEVFAVAGSLALAIAAGVAGLEYWALVIKEVASAVFIALGVWVVCGWRPSLPGRSGNVRELLGFGGNLTGFSLVNYFARNLDDILIGKLFGAKPLGFYQEAYKILMVPLRQLNTPISAVAIPALSRLIGEPDRYRRGFLRILEKILMVTMPLAAVFIVGADWVIAVVLGDQWLEAAPILSWLGLLVFTQPIGNATGWLFITQDRTGEMFRWGILGSGLAVVSFVVGLYWGVVGVAAAYSLSGLVVRMPILLWMVGRRGPVSMGDIYRTAVPTATAGLAALGVLWGGRQLVAIENPFVGFGVAIFAALLTAAIVLLILPSGRRALADTRELVEELKTMRREGEE